MSSQFQIFLSSHQKEFAEERKALKAYIETDALLHRYFSVFMFEAQSAKDQSAQSIYLEQIKQSDIYIGLFGNEYGQPSDSGLSPTHQEYNAATESQKTRLIFIKGNGDQTKTPAMQALIQQVQSQLVRKRFNSTTELLTQVYSSLIDYLEQVGKLNSLPFDRTPLNNATLEDIDSEKLETFLAMAVHQRNYAVKPGTPVEKVLTQLNLYYHTQLTQASVLLFGKQPQRFFISSEVKCLHFHGTQKIKPIPSYQIYKGTVFELADQAIDFVLSKLNRRVGTRQESVQAPVEYDIPKEVVSEAIVNAIVHRDYTSTASVEVVLYSDRLEVWNPGQLPKGINLQDLVQPHSSHPVNPLLAEPMFLAKYIEKAGTGTTDIIEKCQQVGLPTPKFEVKAGCFVLTVYKTQDDEGVSGGASGGVSGGASGGVSGGVSNLLEFIKVNPGLSAKQIAEQLEQPMRTTERWLKKLKDQNKIEFRGVPKTGGYYEK